MEPATKQTVECESYEVSTIGAQVSLDDVPILAKTTISGPGGIVFCGKSAENPLVYSIIVYPHDISG